VLFREPQWTVTTCEARGVSVCIGLAARFELDAAVSAFSPARLAAYDGARVELNRYSEPWPLWYLAVRDPRIVELVLLGPLQMDEEVRAGRVRFHIAEQDVKPRPKGSVVRDGLPSSVAVVMTIGLPVEEESAFYRCMVSGEPVGRWTEMFQRLSQLRRGEVSWATTGAGPSLVPFYPAMDRVVAGNAGREPLGPSRPLGVAR
jgi:hypothetical protein